LHFTSGDIQIIFPIIFGYILQDKNIGKQMMIKWNK